jgi:hypothetical protein
MNHTVVAPPRKSCHNGSYVSQGTQGALAKPTNHIPEVKLLNGAAMDCKACHTSTTSWGTMTMNHNSLGNGAAGARLSHQWHEFRQHGTQALTHEVDRRHDAAVRLPPPARHSGTPYRFGSHFTNAVCRLADKPVPQRPENNPQPNSNEELPSHNDRGRCLASACSAAHAQAIDQFDVREKATTRCCRRFAARFRFHGLCRDRLT